jgi:hypothetical protein
MHRKIILVCVDLYEARGITLILAELYEIEAHPCIGR